MRKLMGDDIQALGEVIDLAGQKDLHPVDFSGIACIVHLIVMIIAEIVEDNARRALSVTAGPPDLSVIIPCLAVNIE